MLFISAQKTRDIRMQRASLFAERGRLGMTELASSFDGCRLQHFQAHA